MSEIRFTSGRAALDALLSSLERGVQDQLKERNINASGALARSTHTDVFTDDGFTTGSLMALSHWKTAGSGSPPRTRVGYLTLAQWAIDKGLASTRKGAERFGSLLSAKIYDYGSKDFREGNPNVYTEAVRDVQTKVPRVVDAFIKDIATPIKRSFPKAS